MKRKLFFLVVILVHSLAIAQDFSLDNKLFKTISWNQFFARLEKNPKLVFFDIRTEGERKDTSQYVSYNQGKIKGAIETDFSDFAKSYPAYLKHKDDTIYLYCSHSRRSRLLAKQLADSSFTKIVSINGGISYLNAYGKSKFPLKNKYYTTSLNYQLISPFVFSKKLNDKNVQVIDVRSDSIYYEKTKSSWERSFGTIKNVVHISNEKVKDNLHLIDKSKEIVLFDNDAETAPIIANYLHSKGYKVGVLLFGLHNLQSSLPSNQRTYLTSKYNAIIPSEVLQLVNNKNTVVIDIRTELEFNSNDSTDWKNVGRLRNAMNLPLKKLDQSQFKKFADKSIVLYDLAMDDDVFAYADKLKEFGCKKVYVIAGGIIQIRWEIYNEDKNELKELLD